MEEITITCVISQALCVEAGWNVKVFLYIVRCVLNFPLQVLKFLHFASTVHISFAPFLYAMRIINSKENFP